MNKTTRRLARTAGPAAVLTGVAAVAVAGQPMAASAAPICFGAKQTRVVTTARVATVTCEFGYTGFEQTFQVPNGAYHATVDLIGGADGSTTGAAGGNGTAGTTSAGGSPATVGAGGGGGGLYGGGGGGGAAVSGVPHWGGGGGGGAGSSGTTNPAVRLTYIATSDDDPVVSLRFQQPQTPPKPLRGSSLTSATVADKAAGQPAPVRAPAVIPGQRHDPLRLMRNPSFSRLMTLGAAGQPGCRKIARGGFA